MRQVDFDCAFVEGLSRLACQTNHGGTLSDPEQIGMPNVVILTVSHDQSERFERLLPQYVAKLFRHHDRVSSKTVDVRLWNSILIPMLNPFHHAWQAHRRVTML